MRAVVLWTAVTLSAALALIAAVAVHDSLRAWLCVALLLWSIGRAWAALDQTTNE